MKNDFLEYIQLLNSIIGNDSFFYLSNDPERALSLENYIKNYHIIHIDDTQYLEYFNKHKLNYFCLNKETKDQMFRSSIKLIKNPFFQEYFKKNSKKNSYIQTFKISPAFEKEVERLNARSINSKAFLNRKFENKISQYNELKNLNIQFPNTLINRLSDLSYENISLNNPFVLQFDRGHTGKSTYFINSSKEFNELKLQNYLRTVRISEFIDGIPYTINCCATKKGTFLGGLSYQITGVDELTSQKGGTVGNDWSVREGLNSDVLQKIIYSSTTVGDHMYKSGYKGLFGIDFVIKDSSVYIIEINARQPASIPMYTKIQISNNEVPLSLLHILELLNIDFRLFTKEYNSKSLQKQNYSQIFLRAKEDTHIKSEVKMGIYRIQSDNIAVNKITDEVLPNTYFLDESRDTVLVFQKEGYNINDIKNGGFVLLTPKTNSLIKKGSELSRIQLKDSVLDSKLNLKPWILNTFDTIKSYSI